jgi:hypothetical protein
VKAAHCEGCADARGADAAAASSAAAATLAARRMIQETALSFLGTSR